MQRYAFFITANNRTWQNYHILSFYYDCSILPVKQRASGLVIVLKLSHYDVILLLESKRQTNSI